MSPRVHVVGAGLAGLSAAVALTAAGRQVVIHEGSAKAGGRCRSYYDEVLDRRIDNGNHLILSGNVAVLAHAEAIGAAHRLEVLPQAAFPFADLGTGARWTVRVPRTPLDALRSDARPPGVTAGSALAGIAGLLATGPRATVGQAVRRRDAMWRAFWEPMATGVLNMAPERGSAALLRAALLRSFFRGAAACRPVLAPEGLGAALIDPAVEWVRMRDGEIRYRAPLQGIEVEGGRAVALRFAGDVVALGPGESVVLALPPTALAALLPALPQPRLGPAILNAHFRVPPEVAEEAPPLLGLLGAQAQWVFRRGDVLSVTISDAEASRVWGMPKDAALDLLWSEVARALDLGDVQPLACRLLRERGATFDQSPEGAALRPGTRTPLANVVLAGDFVRTGLPATLEGAVLSGRRAAKALPQAS